MHKTEITHLQKRHQTQIEIKDRQISDLEEKVSEQKDTIKSLEANLAEKTNELEYQIKEEAIRTREIEFRVRAQLEQQIVPIQTPRENIEKLEKLKANFDKEKEEIKAKYISNLDELKISFDQERTFLKSKVEKAQDTIKRLTNKLTEVRSKLLLK